jgi:hypothetical protein
MSLIDIRLLDNFVIQTCPVHIIEFPGSAGILIGMDIIGMGDFAVCNTNSITSFSFVIPPLPDRINFVDKAEAINKK